MSLPGQPIHLSEYSSVDNPSSAATSPPDDFLIELSATVTGSRFATLMSVLDIVHAQRYAADETSARSIGWCSGRLHRVSGLISARKSARCCGTWSRYSGCHCTPTTIGSDSC